MDDFYEINEKNYYLFNNDKQKIFFNCDKEIDERFSNVNYIKIGKTYNNSLEYLPPKLTHLTFVLASEFNQKITFLPSTLQYIEFGNKFNQLLNNLTNSLIYLSVGYFYEQPLDFLPSSLEELVIRNPYYSQNLMNLPVSLRQLLVYSKYNGDMLLPKDCVLMKI